MLVFMYSRHKKKFLFPLYLTLSCFLLLVHLIAAQLHFRCLGSYYAKAYLSVLHLMIVLRDSVSFTSENIESAIFSLSSYASALCYTVLVMHQYMTLSWVYVHLCVARELQGIFCGAKKQDLWLDVKCITKCQMPLIGMMAELHAINSHV